ncbi:MAG TPA: FHA domain-containing protein [Thermoleophilaceae bacterium]|nr:FHA domain-containing protein [Thermoleophilaceae bacterium]
MEAFSAGTLAGAGSFRCEECGYGIALHERDQVPACPHCGSSSFKRARLFEPPTPIQEASETDLETPDWLAATRGQLDEPGDYLAFEDGDEIRVIALHDEWTRIGRSLSAQVRFDDPTVSRRHSLVHRCDGTARILDDRSLNGVFLNGERIDWHELSDGDEIAVGRFRLFFISAERSPAGRTGGRNVAIA